ncbi:hypothetical protein CERZMDRAFT_88692 [Cercospora zeae-maydis SCOH1-5]|uniref:F-box domain-containing protein n=1 Tax=Cercospora zeae-maydis SCOH1-5 TaxID=717836 RepID=A0A6A6F438_9PEZI|nr:hypothetical protein CERZMDRAFT_88692 [Cercospora zeae-maydis SCOH1-5]
MHSPVHLLSLPAEIRLIIYSFVFTDEWTYFNSCNPTSEPSQIQDSSDRLSPPLLRTCQRLRNEAAAVYYSNLQVHFDITNGTIPPDLINWLNSIGEPHATLLQHFEIRWANYADISLDLRPKPSCSSSSSRTTKHPTPQTPLPILLNPTQSSSKPTTAASRPSSSSTNNNNNNKPQPPNPRRTILIPIPATSSSPSCNSTRQQQKTPRQATKRVGTTSSPSKACPSPRQSFQPNSGKSTARRNFVGFCPRVFRIGWMGIFISCRRRRRRCRRREDDDEEEEEERSRMSRGLWSLWVW